MDSRNKDNIIKNIVQNERFLDRDVFSQWYDSLEEERSNGVMDFSESKRETIKQEMFDAIQSVQEEEKLRTFGRVTLYWRTAAAVFVLLFAMGTIGHNYYNNNFESYLYQSTYGEIKNILLKDGSKVTLNGNSTLRFVDLPDKREAWLTGEASFHVVHKHDNQRFVVHLSDTTSVEVLGTEFNVLNRPNESRVALRNGKVKVDYRPQHKNLDQTYLSPGDLLTFKEKEKGYMVQHANDVDRHFSWQKEQFILNETSLGSMVDMLHHTYGISLKVTDDSLYNRKASGSFPLGTDKDRLLKNVTALYGLVMIEDEELLVLKDDQ
ncbi:FecR domain-containing protein [Olivibacter sp. SDN3]|uniref:FecR family protein n=1 Tax=Olivibacter sp. SDN3 TaxID=2764720 RepID=UPI0016512DE4|nr:FecR domain-containing protein [Olivibacter sp. SDN3]QNL49357.1 FecR domain-containing protein [Olivibacter sp. SDN3]